MIYVENTNEYSQRIYIPKDEADATSGVTGHTVALQVKDYVITENGTTRIHPDGGYDGISGGTIGVYVSAATGVTFQHLDVTEDGLYIPTGNTFIPALRSVFTTAHTRTDTRLDTTTDTTTVTTQGTQAVRLTATQKVGPTVTAKVTQKVPTTVTRKVTGSVTLPDMRLVVRTE